MTLEPGLNKGYVRKLIGNVSRDDFAEALDTIDQAIRKETGQRPSLTLEFQTAVFKKPTEIPEWNNAKVFHQQKQKSLAPRHMWNMAERVTAHFTIATTANNTGIIATVWRNRDNPKEIHFEIEPLKVGNKIGNLILNEHPRYTFWARGLD